MASWQPHDITIKHDEDNVGDWYSAHCSCGWSSEWCVSVPIAEILGAEHQGPRIAALPPLSDCPACKQGLSWDGVTQHFAHCPEFYEEEDEELSHG